MEKSDHISFEQIFLMVCGAGLPVMVRGVHGDRCRRSWLSAVHTGLDSKVRTQDGQQCRKWYEPVPSLVALHLYPFNTDILPPRALPQLIIIIINITSTARGPELGSATIQNH